MDYSLKIAGWMNCYGAWDPSLRHPIETIGYNQYLHFVVASISLLHPRFDCLHILGGMRDAQDRTECATTKPELEQRLAARDLDVPIITHEDVVTTIAVVRTFVRQAKLEYDTHRPLLFCDSARAEANRYLVGYFARKYHFRLDPLKIVVPLPRLDISIDSSPERQRKKLFIMRMIGVERMEAWQMRSRARHLKAPKVTGD